MKVKFRTTNTAFIFGLGWSDSRLVMDGKRHVALILGCLVIEFGWHEPKESVLD